VDTWLIVVIAVVVIGSLSLWIATRGRERRLESRGPEADERNAQGTLEGRGASERELSPREKLVREAGVASFGLNLPWWTRTDSRRQRPSGRRTR
jgi:hypothetical protein